MKTKTIFKETSGFIFKRILIGILSMLIMFAPVLLLFGICRIFSLPVAVFGAIIGFIIGIKLKDLFDKYFGYMIKTAHVAVISEIIETGRVPDNQTEYGKSLVKTGSGGGVFAVKVL